MVLFTNHWLTDRFTETTRSRAELRLALYSGNILTELQRNSVVPLLLARDPELIGALTSGNFVLTSQRLISFQSEIGAASILLLDADGRAVAATNRQSIGHQPFAHEPYLRRCAAVQGHGLHCSPSARRAATASPIPGRWCRRTRWSA